MIDALVRGCFGAFALGDLLLLGSGFLVESLGSVALVRVCLH